MSQPRSDGERLVAAYLNQRGLPWKHEPDVGGRHLDFVTESAVGPVALEVYEPRLTLPNRSGSFNSIEPIEGAFSERKRKQIKAAKGAGLPLILVIGSANSDIPYDVFSIAGVMFGSPGVRVAVQPVGVGPDPVSAFLGPGKVQPEVNRGVSALALVRRFNPTAWRLRAAWRSVGVIGRSGADSGRARREVIERMSALETELTQRGVYQPEARIARLVITHNPFANNPLPLRFAGLHDDQYGPIGDSQSEWGLVATGRLRWEVPDD
ncbi:MAG: hypothetical protein LC799_09990 [Actinobacteria bacterium]|nr:hypothetical protein [Actinomycetota bacterium]